MDGLILNVWSPTACHNNDIESLYHKNLLCLQSSCLFFFLDEHNPSKWLAYLSEGRVGASSTGEIMWLLDLSHPALTHQGNVLISQGEGVGLP
jgi:hypothetical protein